MKQTLPTNKILRLSLVVVLGLVFGLAGNALWPAQSQAATPGIATNNLWRTGVSAGNTPLAANQTDPHYEIARITNATNPPCEPGNIAAGGTPTSPVWPAPAVAIKQYNNDTAAAFTFNDYQNGFDETQAVNPYSPWSYVSSQARWIGTNQYGADYSTPSCVNPSNWIRRTTQDPYNLPSWVPTWSEFQFRAKQSFTITVDPTLVDVATLRLNIVGKADNHMSVQLNSCRLQAIDYKVDGNTDLPTTSPSVWSDSLYYNSQTITNYAVPVTCLNLTGPNSLSFYVRSGWTNTGLLIADMSIEGTPLTPTPPTPPTPPPTPPPNRPYFEANGGDVVAGTTFATSSPLMPCGVATPVVTAGIVSWNNSGSPNYAGAGGQYAALALGYIQDFVSGQGTGQQPTGQETNQLTFANDSSGSPGSVNFSNGLFGGMFGDAPCVDYWNNQGTTVPITNDTLDPGSLADGAYLRTGNVTLSSTTIGKGSHVTLYVDGDVAISGNITYPGGAVYANRLEMPSLRLIVHGTIYIGANVTALDGLYAAIPTSGESATVSQFSAPRAGTITTCSTGFNSYDPSKILTSNPTMYADCNKMLIVTGSVVGQQVWLLRTAGNLGGAAAEQFNYSAEAWLPFAGELGNPAGVPSYQSIVGLPPIL